jgi:hypothetical protein
MISPEVDGLEREYHIHHAGILQPKGVSGFFKRQLSAPPPGASL